MLGGRYLHFGHCSFLKLCSYILKQLPYTWNFSRYVNFTDFAVSRAAVKIYSVKFLPPRIIYEYIARYVACKFVV